MYAGTVAYARWAALSLGILLALSGCGSSAAPVLTVSCRTHRLHSGAIRARVTVTNVSSKPRSGVVYGTALVRLTHIYPVPRQAQVLLILPHGRQYFTGYALPKIRSKKSIHLLMRFAPAPQAGSLVATDSQTVHAGDTSILTNQNCTIQGQR